jgi:hypothetical protein
VTKQKDENINAEISIVPLQAHSASPQQAQRDMAAQNTR